LDRLLSGAGEEASARHDNGAERASDDPRSVVPARPPADN
jgi:hypothetical protein